MRMWAVIALTVVFVAGCDCVRLAPTEVQKENAWAHMQATRMTAATAAQENCSGTVCGLASLGARQAEAFAADYGMPAKAPQGDTPAEVLARENWTRADQARDDSQQRPDVWQAADGLLQFGAGLAGLLGGVYGTRVLRFVNEARSKSKALKEVVEGNELFKKRNPAAAVDFKDAHNVQSQETRQLVAVLK
jgi:hypothetical protein